MKLTLNSAALALKALTHLNTAKYTYERLDKSKAMVLILDMQDGLFSLTHDFNPNAFRDALLGHAALATAFSLPVVITTSGEVGPTGRTLGEITKMHPSAPLIRREGEVNAWDSPRVRDAVKATNRTQIIIAGILTDVCVAFVGQSLREEGFAVWANLEASGTGLEVVRDAANDIMRDAGVHVTSWAAIMGELMRDWRTPPGPTLFPVYDRYSASLGMIARAHRSSVNNGSVVPGEAELP